MRCIFLPHLLLLCALSCHSASDSRPFEVANDFLNAYLRLDFDWVLPLCGSELQADLELSAKIFQTWSPEVQEQRKEELEAYHHTIDNVRLNPSKDSAFVAYTVFTPEAPGGNSGKLTMTLEEEGWKVVAFF